MYSYGKALGVDDDALYDLIHDVSSIFLNIRMRLSIMIM